MNPSTVLDPVQKAAKEQFDRQSARYGKSHILSDVSDVQRGLDRLPALPGKRALDVATGGGHTGAYLASVGYTVTLADIAPSMLQKAQELAASRGFAVTTAEHSAEQMPYADASFDLVTCRVAAHHFSSPAQFLQEVYRILAPGGALLVIDGSVPDDEPEAEEWSHQVEKLRDPSHNRFLTPKSWKQIAAEAGLTVLSSELEPFKQPDIEWYFETANTSPENRAAVWKLIENAPDIARRTFGLGVEDGKTIWYWRRLIFIAQKG